MKKGDRVQRINCNAHDVRVGRVYKVGRVEGNEITLGGGDCWYSAANFRSLETQKKKNTKADTEYTFVTPNEDMICYPEIRENLSREFPVACVHRDGKIKVEIHNSIWKKARHIEGAVTKLNHISLKFYKGRRNGYVRAGNKNVSLLIALCKEIKNTPIPGPKQTVKVRLVKL